MLLRSARGPGDGGAGARTWRRCWREHLKVMPPVRGYGGEAPSLLGRCGHSLTALPTPARGPDDTDPRWRPRLRLAVVVCQRSKVSLSLPSCLPSIPPSMMLVLPAAYKLLVAGLQHLLIYIQLGLSSEHTSFRYSSTY